MSKVEVAAAQAKMSAHYAEHHCSGDGKTGCPIAVANYAAYLTAFANLAGIDPRTFPGVRAADEDGEGGDR